MSGGSVRLHRGRIHAWPKAAIAVLALVLAGPVGISISQAQQSAPAETAAAAPSDQGVASQIEQVVGSLNTMTAARAQASLSELLRGDLRAVPSRIAINGLTALAAAHERLAQEARLDANDPAGQRKAQEQIDAAVAAFVRAGRIALDAEDYVSADQVYSRALAYRPNLPEALLGSARVYARMGNKSLQAIERFQGYLDATKGGTSGGAGPELYVEMGKVYAANNLWHQAFKTYRQAASSGVDTAELASLLADCYLGMNKADEALEQAKKAVARSREPIYHAKYAELLINRRSFEEACQEARNAVNIARELSNSSPGSGSVLNTLHNCFSTYIRSLEIMTSVKPDDLDNRVNLVRAIQEQSEVSRLLTAHRALAIIAAMPESMRSNKAVLEEQVRLMDILDHQDLRATCERLLELDASNSVAGEALARMNASSSPAAAIP